MELLVGRKDLKKALDLWSKLPESYLILSADADTLTVHGATAEAAIQVRIPARTSLPGVVQVDGADLRKVMTALVDAYVQIRIGIGSAVMHIKAGQVGVKLSCSPEKIMIPTSDPASVVIDGTRWATALRAVVPHASAFDDSLSGVWLHEAADGVRLVATDGHTLCYALVMRVGGLIFPENVSIPRYYAPLLMSFLPQATAVGLHDGVLTFVSDSGMVRMKLEKDFAMPDYRQIIPSIEAALRISPVKLHAAATRCARFQGAGSVTEITLHDHGSRLRLTAQRSTDAGTPETLVEDVACDELVYDLWPSPLGINSSLLARCLASTSSEDIKIACGGNLSPLAWSIDSDDTGGVVIMPCRLD